MKVTAEGNSPASGAWGKKLTTGRARSTVQYLKSKGCKNVFTELGKKSRLIGMVMFATGSSPNNRKPRGCKEEDLAVAEEELAEALGDDLLLDTTEFLQVEKSAWSVQPTIVGDSKGKAKATRKKARKLKKSACKVKAKVTKASMLRKKARASLRKKGKRIPKVLRKGGMKKAKRRVK